MNDRNRCLAVLAVAVFMMSACLLMVPSEESDANMTTSQVAVLDSVSPAAEGIVNEGETREFEYRVVMNPDNPAQWMCQFRNGPSGSGYIVTFYGMSDDPEDGGMFVAEDASKFRGDEWQTLSIPQSGEQDIFIFWTANTIDTNKDNWTSLVTQSEILHLQTYTEVVTRYNYTTSAVFDYNYEGGPENVTNSVTEYSVGSTLDKKVQFAVPEDPGRDDGLIFEGWATSPNGEVVIEPGTETVDIQIGEDATYYAIWEVPGYVITYMVDGEVWKTEKVPYDVATAAPTPDPDPPEKYIFAGWYTSTEYAERFEFGHILEGDITLYAKWQKELEFTSKPVAEYNVIKVDNAERTFLFSLGPNAQASEVLWDFGDGDTSDNINPTHYYKEPGVYEVTLTVYNDLGTDTKTFTVDVTDDGGSDNGWLLYVAIVLAVVIVAAVVIRQFL